MPLLLTNDYHLLLWLLSTFRSDEIYPSFWTRSSGSSIVNVDYSRTSCVVLKKHTLGIYKRISWS